MNKVLIIFALFAVASIANANRLDAAKALWSTWKNQHKKSYSTAEELVRFGIFIDNVEKVKKMNAEGNTAKFAINKFADLTSIEFRIQYASSAFPEVEKKDLANAKVYNIRDPLPDHVDWRNKGAVTPVKDQKSCGSCWAFSATGVIEGNYFVQNGKLLSFSEQQIVDCAKNAGHGCQGGWPYLAVQYAAQTGLEVEADYPYTAKDGTCKFTASKAIKVSSGYKFVTPKSSDQLKAALVDGPVSVCLEADQSSFQFYKSGVLATGCGANLNHAVLAVGYQQIGLLEAFIVKNSWGHGWGSDGYIYISTIQQINQGQGVCGILAQPVISLAP